MEPTSLEKGLSSKEMGMSKVIPKTEFLATMEQQSAPIGVRISSSVADRLQKSFSPFVERAFLLFEKDGIIFKAIESTEPNSPRDFFFDVNQLYEVATVMTEEGYSYIGTYHHHLDSDEQIEYRRNPPKGEEAYILGVNYDPIQLSPDDRGVFKGATNKWKLEEGKRQEMDKILSGARYLLLGHFSKKNNYRVGAYTVLSHLPSDHPWNRYSEQLKKNGLMLEHYRGFEDVLNQPIEVVETKDTDPEAVSILEKHGVKNRKYEGNLSDNSDDIIRVFTRDGVVSQVEIWNDKKMIRYKVDRDGLLIGIGEYGDNTTKFKNRNLRFYSTDEIKKAQKDFGERLLPRVKELITGSK